MRISAVTAGAALHAHAVAHGQFSLVKVGVAPEGRLEMRTQSGLNALPSGVTRRPGHKVTCLLLGRGSFALMPRSFA